MNKRFMSGGLVVVLLSMFVGCDGPHHFGRRRPINLTTAREVVQQYYEQGHFETEVEEVVDRALEELIRQDRCHEGTAVIFDVDDTLLWSYYEMKRIQFGYTVRDNHEWVLKADAPVVPHVKQLYDYAVDRGCQIILITGRREDEREATIKNLKKDGFNKIDMLLMPSKEEKCATKGHVLEFKTRQRQLLEEKGYTIVATIGDQYSDLVGGYTDYKIKIPNYTYILY